MKFLDKIVKWFENIGIIRKEEKDRTNDKKDEIVLEATEIQDDESNQKYGFGDIVIANRYGCEEEKKNIPVGHREGPYVIVGSDGDDFLGLYATGVRPRNLSYRYRTLLLRQMEYEGVLSKDTYVWVTKCQVISGKDVSQLIGYMNVRDIVELNKKIEIASERGDYGEDEVPYSVEEIASGDVLECGNEIYIVMDVNEGKYTCLPLRKRNGNFVIMLNGENFVLAYKGIVELKNMSKFKRVNVVPSYILEEIDKNYQEVLEFKKRDGNIERGSIITNDGRYFYVNGELGDIFEGFEIFKWPSGDMVKINVGGENFYTDFANLIQFFKKRHEYTFYGNAMVDEMKMIRDKKKSYQKRHTKRKPRPSKEKRAQIRRNNEYKANIKSGVLVVDEMRTKRYIVITRQDRRIVVINLDSYIKGEYRLEEMAVDCVNYVSLFHPIAFNNLLKELMSNKEVLSNYVSTERIKRLIKE